jgi:AAA domain
MSAPAARQTRGAELRAEQAAQHIAGVVSHYQPSARPLVATAMKSTAKIITMFAEKGGVGKTTQSGSVAWGLAERGHRVLVIDCDAQRSLSNWLLSQRIAQAPFNQDYGAFVNRQDLPPVDNVRPRTMCQQLQEVRNNNIVRRHMTQSLDVSSARARLLIVTHVRLWHILRSAQPTPSRS